MIRDLPKGRDQIFNSALYVEIAMHYADIEGVPRLGDSIRKKGSPRSQPPKRRASWGVYAGPAWQNANSVLR